MSGFNLLFALFMNAGISAPLDTDQLNSLPQVLNQKNICKLSPTVYGESVEKNCKTLSIGDKALQLQTKSVDILVVDQADPYLTKVPKTLYYQQVSADEWIMVY